MADKEQLERLRRGVKEWNERILYNLGIPDAEIDLARGNLTKANLSGAILSKANLKGADLDGADLGGAILSYANLEGANLMNADLSGTNFQNANLRNAYLQNTNLKGANLEGADLRKADLFDANLNRTNLRKADLSEVSMGYTNLGNIDLSEVKGLDKIKHVAPSAISVDALEQSKGKIPEEFLRWCGLSDWEIESAKLYKPELSTKEIDDVLYRVHDLRAGRALQINPLFISYSHKDSDFVYAVEKHLDKKGIRFWRDIHDASAGRLEKVVDRAMRQNPTVLLVLSESSVKSDWVEHEARSARDLEKELKRDVLCPVALDDTWKDCKWPARLREQIMEYNILDFSKWKDEGEFEKMFRKLIDGLDLFYKEA